MAKSNRTRVLEAAARLVEREGVRSVTFESVAAESGLTKGGLLYHFASREELLQAIHIFLADEWEANLVEHAGKSADEATPQERLAAYVAVGIEGSTRAKLLFMLEGSTNPESAKPWDNVLDRWTTSPDTALADPQALTLFLTRLATDGLWIYESMSNTPLDPRLRALIAERLTQSPSAPGGESL